MTANGHTSCNERETFMEFINFDGRVTGETARALIRSAELQGISPQTLIENALRYVLAEATDGTTNTDVDVKVEPMTINAGNGGFHVLTFVADGYGNLVAENSAGMELARAAWDTPDDAEADTKIFDTLAREAFAREEAPTSDG